MTALDVHAESHAHVALLRDSYQRDGLPEAGDDLVHDRHPLVEDVFERCRPPTQELRNLRGPPVAADLFVVAEREVDRPLRLEAPQPRASRRLP